MSGITAQGLTLADDSGLSISGAPNDALTLESPTTGDALNAVNTGASAGLANIDVPITLEGDQSWNVAGSTSITGAGLSGLSLLSTITGPGDALTVGISAESQLLLEGSVATRALTVTGANSADSGLQAGANGTLDVAGPLNAGGGAVTINDVEASFSGGTTGPLTLHGSELETSIGELAGTTLGQGLTVNGALTMDASDATELLLGTDTTDSAVAVTGNATVGGQLALLDLSLSATCPAPTLGTTQTVVQSQGGTLSGTFSDTNGKEIPDGGITNLTSVCETGACLGASRPPRCA